MKETLNTSEDRSEFRDDFLSKEAQQWDKQAALYDQRRVLDINYMNCIRAAIEALNVQQGELVLDAGCGTGIGTEILCQNNISVVALDLSIKSLLVLKEKSGIDCRGFICGNIIKLPFSRASFDRVICANTLQHIPNQRLRLQCIEEFSRVTKTNGRVIVSVHNFTIPRRRGWWGQEPIKEGRAGGFSGDVQYIYRFEPTEFIELLSNYLEVEKVWGAGLPLPYKFKLSPLCFVLEKYLRRHPWSLHWGYMLVARCKVP